MLPPIALFGFMLGIGMLVPVPFTNTLPSLGLAVICVGILNRDGLAVVVGAVLGLAGLIVLAVLIWAIFLIGIHLGEAIEHEMHDMEP
jgi:Uncharacterized ABC-type transport system, permease components